VPDIDREGVAMSIAGELYLLLAVVSVTVFGAGLAYHSTQQSKLERARATTKQRGAAPTEEHAAQAHA
jgi:hypothetical protein